MRVAFAAVLYTATLLAQAPGPAASILVSAPSPRVVSADTVALTAVARDSSGRVRQGDTFTWTSSNNDVLSVDARGIATARTLRYAEVRANVGNIRGSVTLQVVPARVTISPDRTSIVAGERQQFRVAAVDSKGIAIPDVAFTWTVLNMMTGTSVLGAVDRDGNVRTSGAGRLSVRARFTYSGQSDIPFLPFVEAVADLDVRIKTDYSARPLLSTGRADSSAAVLRPRRTAIAAAGTGVALQASLDGIANAVVLFDGGRLLPLATSGTPSPTPSGFIHDFQNFSSNAHGQVLTRALVTGSGSSNGLILASRTESRWLGIEGMSLGGIEGMTNFFVNRNSLSDSGRALIRAAYRLSGETATQTGMFRFNTSGNPDLLASARDGLPGMNGSLTLENDFGIAADGTSFFRASSNADSVVFRQRDYDPPVKVIGTGDSVGTATVTGFANGHAAGFYVGSDASLTVTVNLSNNTTVMLYYPPGQLADPRVVTLRSLGGVFDSRDGQVLWMGNPATTNAGYGLHLWKSDSSIETVLAQGGVSVAGAVQQFEGGALLPGGEVIALLRSADRPFAVVQMQPSQHVLFESGSSVDLPAQLTITGMVQGAAAPGRVFVYTGGEPANVGVIENGTVRLIASHGNRIGTLWVNGFYSSHVRMAPSGQVYMMVAPYGPNLPTYGLYQWNEGVYEEIRKFNITGLPEGVMQYMGDLRGVTDSGWFLLTGGTNRGDNRLYTLKDGEYTLLATNGMLSTALTTIDGKVVNGWGETAIDETGRVMARLTFSDGSTGLYLFENGRWTTAALFAQSRIAGLTVNSLNALRVAGTRFYVSVNLSGNGSAIAEWTGSDWRVLVSHEDQSPLGHPLNGIQHFDVSRDGEIVFYASSFSWPALLRRSASGSLSVGHYAFDLDTLERPIVRYQDIDLRDDGTVYFTAIDSGDRLTLYEAQRR